jgi:hypothetical protein
MPITINGSGTLTGISVGGLPDGIVDTDMIADDSVTKIKRGSGSILQTVNYMQTAVVSRTTSSHDWGSIMNTPTYSVTRAGTKSLILVTAYTSSDNTTGRYGLRLMRWSSTDAYENLTFGDAAGSRQTCNMAYRQNSDADFGPMSFAYLDTHGKAAGTNIQYNLYTSGEDTNVIYINRSNGDADNNTQYRPCSSMIVMEIDS